MGSVQLTGIGPPGPRHVTVRTVELGVALRFKYEHLGSWEARAVPSERRFDRREGRWSRDKGVGGACRPLGFLWPRRGFWSDFALLVSSRCGDIRGRKREGRARGLEAGGRGRRSGRSVQKDRVEEFF